MTAQGKQALEQSLPGSRAGGLPGSVMWLIHVGFQWVT
jgi:hypothetical protein